MVLGIRTVVRGEYLRGESLFRWNGFNVIWIRAAAHLRRRPGGEVLPGSLLVDLGPGCRPPEQTHSAKTDRRHHLNSHCRNHLIKTGALFFVLRMSH